MASWYSKTPLSEDAVVEASRRLASRRTAEVAKWSHSIERTTSRLSQSDFEALWRACPYRDACLARGACLQALAREVCVWRARNAIRSK